MLATITYTKQYVDACRLKVARQLAVYKRLVIAANGGTAASPASVKVAIEAFEPVYFGNLLVALDGHFVHRLRAVEGKDGNPLNEVRMLCNALMSDNVLHADKSIKYVPGKSVLEVEIGQAIRLTAKDFKLLSRAFLTEVERKYT